MPVRRFPARKLKNSSDRQRVHARATSILSSATPGRVADDSKGANSVLMSELLNHLKTKEAGAEAVFNKTRVAITRASDGEQVPSVSSSLLEDVRFGAIQNAGS